MSADPELAQYLLREVARDEPSITVEREEPCERFARGSAIAYVKGEANMRFVRAFLSDYGHWIVQTGHTGDPWHRTAITPLTAARLARTIEWLKFG